MPYQDIREFIERLEDEGELVRIKKEVKAEPDVGAIGRATCDLEKDGSGPAILCENVKGYKIPLVFGLHSSERRVALSLGLSKKIGTYELFQEFCRRYDKYPIEPRRARRAPCKEVIKLGTKADLTELPIVRWNTGDAAPFITKGCIITKDPDTGLPNIGLYRLQLKGARRLGIPTVPSHDIGRHIISTRKKGKNTLEIAIAIGTDPCVQLASVSPIPEDWGEYAYAGALRGAPVDTVDAETVNLPVPANAEIVIEGVIHLDKFEVEGPFAEFPGYYSHTRRMPEIEVTAITHKVDPIFEGLYIGKPPTEADSFSHMPNCVTVYKQAKLLAPELRAFNLASSWCMVGIAAMSKDYAGQDKKVMSAVLATRHAAFGLKVLLIVDDDVDPFNMDEVLWAMSARFNPDNDIVVIPNATRNNLDPTIPGIGYGAKLVLDLTAPRQPEPVPAIDVVRPPPKTQEWKDELIKMIQESGKENVRKEMYALQR